MTAILLACWSESDQTAVRDQLGRILSSGPFLHSRRRQRFLEYIVTETLAGRGERLKGYNIAVEVFDRPESFDPAVDPLVRIEAARLRDKLREYYESEGQNDPIRVDLPKGAYAPHIEIRRPVANKADALAQNGSTGTARTRWGFLETPFRTLGTSIIAILLLLLASFGAWQRWNSFAPLPEKASIAVLPFESIGNDPQVGSLC